MISKSSISNSLRIVCQLLEQKVTVTRCTDLLLERFDVMPDTTLTDLQERRRLSRIELDDLCRSCPYNPVEDRHSGERPESAARSLPAPGSRSCRRKSSESTTNRGDIP